MFSDDAFNKNVAGDAAGGAGTLIGNWSEERSLRDACGEGRTVPQRHQPRSGLLKDFTKVPSSFRATDNTFERVYGPKGAQMTLTSSGVHGLPDPHGGKIVHVGPRESGMINGRRDLAEAEVQDEETVEAEQANVRRFETTTGFVHAKPDHTQAVKAQHARASHHHEILHGPEAEPHIALANEALYHPTHAHYSNAETMTHARMSLADPRMKSDLKATAASGHGAFGKNSEFSKPVQESIRGMAKDEDLDQMFHGLKGTEPTRHVGGHQAAGPFAGMPSLATLKAVITSKIAEVWGAYGYVMMRQKLFDVADHEGFVQKADVVTIFRHELGLSTQEVPKEALDVYLQQHITMKRTELRIGALMSSLRPVLPQRERRRVLEGFKALGPVNGEVRLGEWLRRLQDDDLRATLITAFGAQDEAQVEGMPVSEQIFTELFADLAPFIDISALLA